MERISTSSIQDVLSTSEDENEDVEIMARSAERQLADAIPVPRYNSKPNVVK